MTPQQVRESEWGQSAEMEFGLKEDFDVAVKAIASGKPVIITIWRHDEGGDINISQKESGDFIDEYWWKGDAFDEMCCVNDAVKFCNEFGLDWTIERKEHE